MKKQNKPLSEIDKKILSKIKLIVFDVDGILVPRGSKISQKGNRTILYTKKVQKSTRSSNRANKKSTQIRI